MLQPSRTQRATEEPCQSHSSPAHSYGSSVAPCLHAHVRHVQVEAGIHTIGEAAWQHCNRLQIVQLPSTVVCLQDGAFRRNYVLRTVIAPGCKYFGLWVFEECYSLAQIGDQSTTVNQLAPQAQFRPRAFEKCSTLQQLNFERTEYDPTNLNRTILKAVFSRLG